MGKRTIRRNGQNIFSREIYDCDFIIALALWVTGSFINVDATLTAFIALSLLLLTGVLNWKDILNESGA